MAVAGLRLRPVHLKIKALPNYGRFEQSIAARRCRRLGCRNHGV